MINILAADKLMLQAPKVYATFLLWMLSELLENLPEIGDPEKPKLVFFFDEAHLLFTDIAPAVAKIEQMVRLSRSRASVFISSAGIRSTFRRLSLGRLGNRVQTRVADVYAARSESGESRRRNLSAKSKTQSRDSAYRIRNRRSARFDAR